MKRLFIILYIILPLTLLANDSLKVKTISYYSEGKLVRVERYDTLKRMVSLSRTTYIVVHSGKVVEQEFQIFDYFGNSNVIKSNLYIYLPKDSNKALFRNNPIGTALITEYDSTKRESKEFSAIANIDKKYLNRWILKDSVIHQLITFEKKDKLSFSTRGYDSEGRIINEKHRVGGQIIYKSENTYDSESRIILSYIETKFDEKVFDDEMFSKTYVITEKSILKTTYNDINKTSESIIETYRKDKLQSKKLLKNYYDLNKNILLQEEYEYKIDKNKETGEVILVSKTSNIYENGLRRKHIIIDYVKNQNTAFELFYEFW